jgi:biotin carboxyl carrier protein
VKFELTVGETQHKISKSKGSFFLDDLLLESKIYKNSPTHFYVHYENKMCEIEILNQSDKRIDIKINGKKTSVHVKTDLDLMLEKMGMISKEIPTINKLDAPMPGNILDVLVSKGDKVAKGDPLLILEAMKMENVIKAPADVTIQKINVLVGDNVEKNQTLIEF